MMMTFLCPDLYHRSRMGSSGSANRNPPIAHGIHDRLFAMLITSGGLADTATLTAAEQAQLPLVVSSGQRLAALEANLRNTFGQITISTNMLGADATVPDSVLALMKIYNRAQASYMESANLWLLARRQTPKDELPDPDATPQAVPVFTIPAVSGLGGTVRAADIHVVVGPVGAERSIPLGGYVASGMFGQYMSGPQGYQNGLGAFPLIPLFWLLGVAIVVTGAIFIIRAIQSGSVTASEATIAQANADVEIALAQAKVLQEARDGCLRAGGDAVACIKQGDASLKQYQEGLQQRNATSKGIGVLGWLGILVLLGGATAVGIVIWRRRQSSGSHYSRSVGDDDGDDDDEEEPTPRKPRDSGQHHHHYHYEDN
jgi:hypothetical protein